MTRDHPHTTQACLYFQVIGFMIGRFLMSLLAGHAFDAFFHSTRPVRFFFHRILTHTAASRGTHRPIHSSPHAHTAAQQSPQTDPFHSSTQAFSRLEAVCLSGYPSNDQLQFALSLIDTYIPAVSHSWLQIHPPAQRGEGRQQHQQRGVGSRMYTDPSICLSVRLSTKNAPVPPHCDEARGPPHIDPSVMSRHVTAISYQRTYVTFC